MRAPGDILLLSTYELGHQPLHLASPLGFFAEAGFAPRAIDLHVEKLDEEAVRRARLIAIAVPMHTALRLGMRVARRVRALNPRAHLCFYGLYAPLHRAHLIEEAGGRADSVIGGEFEVELVALARRLESENISYDNVIPRSIVLDKLAFPRPARGALPPLARYAHLLVADEQRTAGYVEASRGCLHQCRHCPIPSVYDGRFFVVQEKTVIEDIRQQVAAGARHITFGDPDFLNGPEHALRVARALHRELPEVTFDATAKIEHLLKHRAMLPELKSLGCLFVVSAVESLSERVLTVLDKGHTRADVDLALELTRAAGITLRPSLMPFSPWETLASYRELLAFIAARDLVDQIEPIHLAIRLLIPPGSKLLELAEVQALVGPLDAAALSYTWSHPDPRMDALQRAVYAAVEAGTAADEDPRATFFRVQALALAVADGRPLPATPPGRSERGPARAPRLSEAWFC
ncbi:MAG TPA: CUAEP/CCAEP-tail radical SAM protein [Polyangia bacterium]